MNIVRRVTPHIGMGDAGSNPVLTTRNRISRFKLCGIQQSITGGIPVEYNKHVNLGTHTALRWAKLDTISRSWK